MKSELLSVCPKCKKLGRFERHYTERDPQYELVAYSIQYEHPDGRTCKVGVAIGLDEVERAENEFRFREGRPSPDRGIQ